ncbi:putative Late nodulin [Medicago truncatula]|uniref:Nodule Cysteine-Rich (NCR) secreted peptide n=1 Tax=Medicago truncatula TaxID=3880 RepID=G7JZB1_MEDTR|nr:Nodule Cysteine-Rich (NCR) secreted peptide [Medicago truncatula]RHN55689.1 putative Late nodulin [Medicago truncatula]
MQGEKIMAIISKIIYPLTIFISLLLIETIRRLQCKHDSDCQKDMCRSPEIAKCVYFVCECV